MKRQEDNFERTMNSIFRYAFGAIAIGAFIGVVIGAWWQFFTCVVSYALYLMIGKDGTDGE